MGEVRRSNAPHLVKLRRSEILKEKCTPSKYAPEAGLFERDSLNSGAKEVEVKKKIKDKSEVVRGEI